MMWACWLNTNELTQTSSESDPSSAGQNILDSSRQAENKILRSGSDTRLCRANCGFISSVRAELQLAGPSTNRLKLLWSTLVDKHPVIPVSGVHECVRCKLACVSVCVCVACSLLIVPSVCLPISKPTEQVLPQRAAKTQKTANKRWHSFFCSTYSHACAQQNVKASLSVMVRGKKCFFLKQ